MPEVYLVSSFSFNFIALDDLKSGVNVKEEYVESLPDGLTSAVGHESTAKLLGVPFNRMNMEFHKGDTLYVAQYYGPRLPEGCTVLPEGAKIIFLKVTIG